VTETMELVDRVTSISYRLDRAIEKQQLTIKGRSMDRSSRKTFASQSVDQPDSEQGLYRKYKVQRLHDPKRKHTNCHYFVLDADHDKFASVALLAYATACEAEFPHLATDIRSKLVKFPVKQDKRVEENHSRPFAIPCKGPYSL